MKTLKFMLAAVLMLVSGAAMAQYQGRPQGQRPTMTVAQIAEREVQRIDETVTLKADQKAAILKVATKYAAQDSVRRAEMRAQREAGQQQNFDREAMMKQYRANQEAKTAEYNAIFDAQQQKKYAQMLQDMQNRMNQRPQGQGRPQGQRPQGPRN